MMAADERHRNPRAELKMMKASQKVCFTEEDDRKKNPKKVNISSVNVL